MRKIYLGLLPAFLFVFVSLSVNAQNYWQSSEASKGSVSKDKAVTRVSFPTSYKLFSLNITPLRQLLFASAVTGHSAGSAVISLPNADGNIEQFEVYQASNFDPALQAQFPQIRAFSGKGITDKAATLKLSISPQGIQTMIFRSERATEFIEPFSQDHTVYAVFKSQRNKGSLPWTCSTEDQTMFAGINARIQGSNFTASNAGELKTIRLAQSCNGEYANYFGAFNSGQVALVLAAYNATLTRCNGTYEKDLALHLNLIASTTDVIFYDPATDPYTSMGAWNGQLQATLTANIGEANYDIGHLFGASGGGGNAGCIGCVCVDGIKGRGYTSPADAIPQGDNFDIDYVAHEIGHQLGANHTFSQANEGTGVNKEVGSGITIMGYAGITNQDVADHSIDIWHQASIQQIQVNLATKTCPITTSLAGTNATPVVAAVPNYIIPITTPFALTGSATDANAGDVLTYCWEQNDNSTTTGANSVASPTKLTGPNWLTFPATTSPVRFMPRLSTILAGGFTTGPLPGGDAIATIEALSSVSRTLNFRLTVRDNVPYSSSAPIKVGQTNFTDMIVTVSNTSGPFQVTSPNTNVSYPGGSVQNITWLVNNTTLPPVSCSDVRILFSTDGGLTFPTVLSATTANDGSESVTIPAGSTTTARIKVESVGNIFFDISNTNFTVTVPVNSFTFNATTPTTTPCPAANPTVTIGTTVTGTFTTPIVLSSTGAPAGTTVTFAPNPLTPGSSTVATLNNANTLGAGTYNVTVTGTAGTTVQTTTITYIISAGPAPVITTQPVSQSVCAPAIASFTVATSTAGATFQWQVSTAAVPAFTNIPGATSASYNTSATTTSMNGNIYRVIVTTQCGSTTSSSATLTVNTAAAISTQPTNQFACTGNTATFTVGATGTGVTYQWQSAPAAGGPFTNVSTGTGGTTASYTTAPISGTTNGFYRVIVTTTTCAGSVTSSVVTLTITTTTSITSQPVSQTVCAPATASFSVTATGSGLSYQWQVSTAAVPAFTNIAGAQSSTYITPATSAAMNGNVYRVIVSNSCNTVTSANATLTVNTAAAITTQPTNQSACTGNTATFTVSATGTGVTYQWQSATAAAGPFTNVTTGTGGTTPTYTTATVTVTTPGFYRVIVTTTTCAGSVTSNVVTLTITQTTAITTQPASQTVCAPGAATFSVSAVGANLTYQWQVSTAAVPAFTNIGGATGASYNTGATSVAMSGNSYHVVITGTCNTVTSNNVTLTVNAAAAIATQPTDQTVCNGTTATFTAAATGTGVTYQWQQSTSSTGPFTNVSTGTGGTTASYTTPVTTPAMNNTYYRVVATTTSCAGSVTSNVVKLTVNTVATIVTQPTAQSACVPNPVTFTVTASGTGLTYQWQISTNGGTSFTDIPGATAASYTIPVTAFSMNGSLYRVNILSTCSPTAPTTSNAVALTVNNPVAVTQQPQPQRGCAGDNYTFSVNATGGTLSYQWQVSTNGGVSYTNVASGGTSSTYTINNAPLSLNGSLYRVIVTGTPCGQVITPGALLTLGNKPNVSLTLTGPSSLNPSLNSAISATVNPAGSYLYELRRNGVVIPNTLVQSSMPVNVDGIGTYQLTVTDLSTGCSALSNIIKIDSLPSAQLFISPNPVSTIMQVRYYNSSAAPRGTMINVYDGKGARVFTKPYNVAGPYGSMDVDMTNMITGIYVVELMDASGKKLAAARVLKR